MTNTGPKNIAAEIRALDAQGLTQAEIVRRLGCTGSNVSQVLSRTHNPAPRVSDGLGVNRFRPKPPGDTCQRPDARNGFAPCGEPKMRTACGERLGVCQFHYETTKPTGGMKF